ncbi:MAG TPA: thioesterase [Aggregatilinea sp.]|uniref:acyl-[acyl-carrier-protein] thioesterase n=1 Tax=Aggregatilinea sp. TaxID=2806333 RepID=UPI002C0E60BD|nr:thioesterase family protein [Aggregatilinea sp.]HML21608.1 thioesterase [Aggregatilinea sp.]
MPLTHRRVFRVRHYECDAYGHVNHANYLRYMQEAAMDASATVGYDEARYIALGTFWLIRETDIEYLRPLLYGDQVEVTTWVGDFRRVRSRRFYEMRHTGTGELVARANTDWVYLDRSSARPIGVPPEMVEAFAPPGVGDDTRLETMPREHFPEALPAPPGAFTMHRRVEWRDIDSAQHVNNAAYLNYMEECGILAAESVGWTIERMRGEGFAIFARRHQIEYRQQAPRGEELAITTYLSNVRHTSATRHYLITRASDGALITQARTVWVFVNLETGLPMRVPASFQDDFAASIAR